MDSLNKNITAEGYTGRFCPPPPDAIINCISPVPLSSPTATSPLLQNPQGLSLLMFRIGHNWIRSLFLMVRIYFEHNKPRLYSGDMTNLKFSHSLK